MTSYAPSFLFVGCNLLACRLRAALLSCDLICDGKTEADRCRKTQDIYCCEETKISARCRQSHVGGFWNFAAFWSTKTEMLVLFQPGLAHAFKEFGDRPGRIGDVAFNRRDGMFGLQFLQSRQ
jgi:hypothetical protein